MDPENEEIETLLVGPARRRQMTLLFCDVVGSTAIADALDPEETGQILRAYRAACTECIQRFGGYTDEHKGDGTLVRFGYPEVHEDDARRAVMCGLAIIQAVRRRVLAVPLVPPVELHVRVSVHSDLVVLEGSGLAGAAASEAARLQAVAVPDTVVISDATEALVRQWFDVVSMGQVELRGVRRPVEVFTVLRERPVQPHVPGPDLTPFSGRRAELRRIAALASTLRAAAGVRGPAAPPRQRTLLVTGPAGIGKSRLVREAARLADVGCLECDCSRYHRSTSLSAFRPLLERACGITDGDDADRRLSSLRKALDVDPDAGPDLPFLAAAVGIPLAAMVPPTDVSQSLVREEALAAAASLVRTQAAAEHSLVFVDDVHWADESTLDLVSALVTAPGPPVVLAAREEFAAPWDEGTVPRLRLDVLSPAELQSLVREMPEGSHFTDAERAELVDRSDGIPLFLEELVRTADAVASGRVLHRSLHYADHQIPAALRDPLLARLTAPGVDLELAQIAATIGRDVDDQLLRCLAGAEDGTFQARVHSLVVAGLVTLRYGQGIRFRHELIREVAYETQPRAVLRGRHSRIADLLLAREGSTGQSDAGQAAYHLEGARRYPEAVELHVRAAQADQAVGAHAEAARRLTGALQLLQHLPGGEARVRTELTVRQLRSFSAVTTRGYAAHEAEEDYPRCVRLCEDLGQGPELLPCLMSSWSYFTFRADLTAAEDVGARMERVDAPGDLGLAAASMGRGVIAFFQGRYTDTVRLLDTFVAHPWAHTQGGPPAEWPLPNDPLACVGAHLAAAWWLRGDRARSASVERPALDRAAELPFPYGLFSLGYINSLRAFLHRLDGDHAGAEHVAIELVELGERHGFLLWAMTGAIQRGISRVHAGDDSVLPQVAAQVAAWPRDAVGEVWTPYLLTELAAAQRVAGRAEEALGCVEKALTSASSTGTHFYTAETLRLRGELRSERGDGRGRKDLQGALDLARRQGARALEERVLASLERVAGP